MKPACFAGWLQAVREGQKGHHHAHAWQRNEHQAQPFSAWLQAVPEGYEDHHELIWKLWRQPVGLPGPSQASERASERASAHLCTASRPLALPLGTGHSLTSVAALCWPAHGRAVRIGAPGAVQCMVGRRPGRAVCRLSPAEASSASWPAGLNSAASACPASETILPGPAAATSQHASHRCCWAPTHTEGP